MRVSFGEITHGAINLREIHQVYKLTANAHQTALNQQRPSVCVLSPRYSIQALLNITDDAVCGSRLKEIDQNAVA